MSNLLKKLKCKKPTQRGSTDFSYRGQTESVASDAAEHKHRLPAMSITAYDVPKREEPVSASTNDALPATNKASKRFDSFVGKFGVELWGKTDEAALQENLETLTHERLLKLATSMGKELGALYKAVAILNKLAVELDVYKAIENIRSFVLELLGCESVTLFLVDHETQMLRCKILSSLSLQSLGFSSFNKQGLRKCRQSIRARVTSEGGDWLLIQTAVGEGIAGRVALTGSSLNISDPYACDAFNPAIDRATNFLTKSLLCCPIADISGKHVAVIQAVNKLGGSTFRPADEANLELFGVHLGNTLTKSRLYASIMFEKQRLEKLNEGIRDISSPALSLESLVAAINRTMFSALHSEHTMLFFVDFVRDQLWSKWQSYPSKKAGDPAFCTIAAAQGLLGRVCTEGSARSTREISLDSLGLSKSVLPFERAKCCLLQPVADIRGGRVVALMACFNKRTTDDGQTGLFSEPRFSVNDLNAMALFAVEVARVLSERSLEISFANALTPASSSDGDEPGFSNLEAALQAQLASYACLEEMESVAGSLRVQEAALAHDIASQTPSPRSAQDATTSADPLSLADSLEKAAVQGLRSTIRQKSQRLRRWDLDIHFLSKEDLMVVVFEIFADAGVLDFFGIEERPLMLWISKVAGHYRENPYHNWQHVVHVLHAVHLTLVTTEAAQHLTRTDQLALLIAAICHDIDHDGKTNSFHVATASDKARCYNDISVLENHHCALTADLIAKCGLLNSLSKPCQLEIRKTIIAAILATDMSAHFSLTTDFKNHEEFRADSPEDRLLLCKTILHAADLSNPTLPFAANSYISQNVHAEFKMQVQAEIALGLTPMPHMNAKDERVQCLLEVSFIDAVVAPLWEHLALLFPALKPCVDQIHRNRGEFQRLTQRRTQSVQEELRAAMFRMSTTAERTWRPSAEPPTV